MEAARPPRARRRRHSGCRVAPSGRQARRSPILLIGGAQTFDAKTSTWSDKVYFSGVRYTLNRSESGAPVTGDYTAGWVSGETWVVTVDGRDSVYVVNDSDTDSSNRNQTRPAA